MLAYDALLGYPVQRFKSPTSVFLNMQSIAERLLSRASAAAAAATPFTPHVLRKSTALPWLDPANLAGEDEEEEEEREDPTSSLSAGAHYAFFELNTLRLLASSLPDSLLSVIKLNWLLHGLKAPEDPPFGVHLPFEDREVNENEEEEEGMEVVVRVEPPILVLLLHPRPSPREILVEGAAAMAKEVRALMAPFGKGPLRSPVVATCGVLEHLISPLEMAALSHFTGEAVCRAVAELHAELRALHPRSSIGWLRWDPDGGLYGNAIRDLLPDTARRLTRLMRATRMTKTYGVDADHWVAIDSGIVHVSLHHEEVLGVVIQGIPQLQACLDFVARLQRIVL